MSIPVNSQIQQPISDEVNIYHIIEIELLNPAAYGKSKLTNSPVIRKLSLAYDIDYEVFQDCTSNTYDINDTLSLMFIRSHEDTKNFIKSIPNCIDVCKFNKKYIVVIFVDSTMAQIPNIDQDISLQIAKTVSVVTQIFNIIFSVLNGRDIVYVSSEDGDLFYHTYTKWERGTMVGVLDRNIDLICGIKFTLDVFGKTDFMSFSERIVKSSINGSDNGLFDISHEDLSSMCILLRCGCTVNKKLVDYIDKFSIENIIDDYALHSLLR